MNDYTATLEAADISYNIGAPGLIAVSPYRFDEDPVCNYPETVTLTDLPAFVTHNAPASDDFDLGETSDLSLIGAYKVTLRSQIEVPTDHTQTDFTTLFAVHDFFVFMEPCIVNTYTASTVVSVIVYNVNQADLTAGFYSFDEDPVCNYPETVTVTDLPAFAVHNEPTSDFTIPQNNDLGLIGEYTVTLRSQIEVPTDYTQSAFASLFVEYEFVIQVEECVVSAYSKDQVLTTVSYNIGKPALTTTPYSFVEDPPCAYPETVTLTGLPAFVTHNVASSTFTIP